MSDCWNVKVTREEQVLQAQVSRAFIRHYNVEECAADKLIRVQYTVAEVIKGCRLIEERKMRGGKDGERKD